MKKLIYLSAIAVALAALSVSALAQDPATTAQATGCTDEFRDATYNKKFLPNRTPSPAVAYEAAKEYLSRCTTEDTYTTYLKGWIVKYEKAQRKTQVENAAKANDFKTVFSVGRQVVQEDPSDARIQYMIIWSGMLAYGQNIDTHIPDTLAYGKMLLKLVDAGAVVPGGTSKEDSISRVNYVLGIVSVKSSPKDAIDYLLKAIQSGEFAKKDPQTYSNLGGAYNNSDEYEKRAKAFEPCQGKPETPECKATLESLYLVVDRIIDAYARAVALATDTRFQSQKTVWLAKLTDFYKFRHEGSDAGLTDLISIVVSQPLPTGLPQSGSATPTTGPVQPATASTAPKTSTP